MQLTKYSFLSNFSPADRELKLSFDFCVNLLAFYQEQRSLIGYTAH